MSELQQQIVSKVKTNCTYPSTANYWAPLEYEYENEDALPQPSNIKSNNINNISDAEVQRNLRSTIMAWVNQRVNKHKPFRRVASTMVIDSGATSSFVRPDENLPITGASNKIVNLPDGSSIRATHTTMLPFESLSDEARKADVLPGLRPNSLVSVGKFSDAGYTTVFHPHGEGVTVHKKNTLRLRVFRKPVLQGWRDASGLWRVSRDEKKQIVVSRSKKETAASAYSLPSISQTIQYLHAAAGFPTKDSWIKAINNGNYKTWPGITAHVVNKHFPEAVETQKGHMKKQRQNVRSTKQKVAVDKTTEDGELTKALSKHNIMVAVINVDARVFTDQTGRLPVQSSRGNTSLMVYFDVDANYIDAEPIRTHHDSQMIPAYQNLWKRTNRGRTKKPNLHILDNEASEAFKAEIRKNCELQLVPPDTHRRNLAERAIQTFKSHFIAILAGVDESFPMNLWDRLVPQAVLTLNLLRQSHKNPSISAYQHVNGNFDYNKLPLAPLGCAVEMHESPNRRKTWDPRSLSGWYLGTSTEHYRCHKIFCKKTRAERISDTVFFNHRYITQPSITSDDVVVKAIGDLSAALRQRVNTQGDQEMSVLKQMNDILNNMPVERKQNVTSKECTPEPRVPLPEPRVMRQEEASGDGQPANPKRVTAMQPINKATVIAPAKERWWAPNGGITTRSKYARAVAEIGGRRHSPRLKAAEELAQAIMDDRPIVGLEYANEVFDEESGKLLKYRALITHPKHGDVWLNSSANEFGRLAQGVGGRIKGTNTIYFIYKHQVPQDRWRDVTYAKFVCEVKPNKAEVHRTRLTVGGDKVHYPGDVGTPTADLTLVKAHANSVISTPGARYMTLDVKNFYLNTPMGRYEYVRIKIEDIPEEIILEYNLRDKATPDGYVYIEIRKGMYGLPQAGILAQQLLETRLNTRGYSQSRAVPGLWTHKTRPISFTLVVDDFGVKYVGKEQAAHLISILKEDYEISQDWTGGKYIGITFDWDYVNRRVHLSMPGYITKALQRFAHERPRRIQNSPHQHVVPTYGAKVQYVEAEVSSELLDKAGQKHVQAVTGTLLYYARAVDSTMLVALNAIATQQASPTQKTMERVQQLLDYAASQEDAILTYHASDMVLAIHSDAGYLNETKSRSRAGGHFFLSSDSQVPQNNGAILTIAQIIDAVMSSAAEAELGALFINAKEAVHLRRILIEMGHPQPRTPIQTDNSTAEGVINARVRPKRTKAMDMRFEWLLDRQQQGQFKIYWRPGKTNLADYFTKHHSPAHHRNVRGEFLTRVAELQRLRQASSKSAMNHSKETNLTISDGNMFPKFSARVY